MMLTTLFLCVGALLGRDGDAKTGETATSPHDGPPKFSFLIGAGGGIGSAYSHSAYPLATPRNSVQQPIVHLALRGRFWEISGFGAGKELNVDNLNYEARVGLRPIRVRKIGLFLSGRSTATNEHRELFSTADVQGLNHAYTTWTDGGASIGIGNFTGKLATIGVVMGQAYARDKLALNVSGVPIIDDDQVLRASRSRYEGIRVHMSFSSPRWRVGAVGLFMRLQQPAPLFERDGYVVSGEVAFVPLWHIAIFASGTYSAHLRGAGPLNTSTMIGIGFAK